MRIIFFGADPWFSPPVLEALLAAGHEVPAAVTKGKKGKEFIGSLAHKILKKNLSDRALKTLISQKTQVMEAKTAEDVLRFTICDSRFTKDNRPEAIVLAAFGPPFLPAEVLNWPKYGCLNVHASLLPRWRGASPVFAALQAGDKETGVSIMRMTEEIDRGPILGQKKLMIKSGVSWRRQETPDNRETLTKRLGELGGELIVETLKKLEKGQITETPQPKISPTPYTRRLTKESGRINWRQSPIEIERFIRAAFPWPCAMSNLKFKTKNEKWQTIENVKILKAHLETVRDFREVSRFSREANDDKQQLRLVIDLVQLPGKTPITWKQFLAGHPDIKFVHGPKKAKSRR